jgi:hypothetical protein
MISARMNGGEVNFDMSVGGLAVYLDNWAILDLAKHNPARRQRFIDAMRAGADLMFSVTNAAELSGPQGRSADLAKEFLNEIGPRWFPTELDVMEVCKRESEGASPSACCVAKDFLKAYVASRMSATKGVVSLSEDIFCLGPLLDPLSSQRDSIRDTANDFDARMKALLLKCRVEYERNPAWLDQRFPQPRRFSDSRRATFVLGHLVRNLVVDAKSQPLKPHDAMDLCHAVMAAAFASVAALDGPWKQRIEALPEHDRLARVYYGPELDQMVTDLESLVAQLKSRPTTPLILTPPKQLVTL